MTNRRLACLLLVGALALVLPACGDDSGGDCPSMDGNWLVMQHCNSDFVGMPIGVVQEGCTVSVAWVNGITGTGTVSPGGAVTMLITVDATTTIDCLGTLVGNALSMNCEESGSSDCRVVLNR